jgi:hypothetical protein
VRAGAQIERGVDEPYVRKGLRKISKEVPSDRVVFLREESDVISQREKPFE